MKDEKACGSDVIPTEFWNLAASENLYVEVLRLFNKTLEFGDDNIDPILRDVIIHSYTREDINLIAITSEHCL